MDYENEILQLKREIDVLRKDIEQLKKKHPAYQKKWLSMSETIEHTGYKRGTIYQLRRTREVTYRKSGGGLQFERESLDAYLKAREHKSKSELVEEYNKN